MKSKTNEKQETQGTEVELTDFCPEVIKVPYVDDIPDFFESLNDKDRFKHIINGFEEFFKQNKETITCWIIEFEHSDKTAHIVIDDKHAEEIAQEYLDVSIENEEYEYSQKFKEILNKLKS